MAGEHTPGQHSLAVAPTLRHVARLQRDRHYRDTHGRFFVEGVRNFVTAVDDGCIVDILLYSERLLTSPIARKLVRRLKRAGVPFARVSPEQFRAISCAKRASGVGAVLRQNIKDLPQITPGDSPCWIVLNQVRAPGNFGTLVRTSAAIGGAGFILLGDGIDPFDPAVVRASMGGFFRQIFVRASAEQLRQWVHQHKLLVVGASPDGTIEYDQVHYSHPTVLVLGEERGGLTADQRALCQQIVRIPMVAGADSLNLGVAGSLLMYAVVRALQRP
jgi:RNA methyltransferase, TrmH family